MIEEQISRDGDARESHRSKSIPGCSGRQAVKAAAPGEQGLANFPEPTETRDCAAEPARVLFSRRVATGHEADFEAWADGIAGAARLFPGFRGSSVFEAPAGEYHVLYSFVDPAALDTWLVSPERLRWMEEVGEMTLEEHGPQTMTGLETWFDLPAVPAMKTPARWKTWLVSLIAVYPFVLLFQALVAPEIAGLPGPIQAMIWPLTLLTLMTFVVMPTVTARLRSWLRQ
jgi:antibiotic biosynthesis monooxygenase (ABM) superfamily enzyme